MLGDLLILAGVIVAFGGAAVCGGVAIDAGLSLRDLRRENPHG